MAREFSRAFYDSTQWKKCRASYRAGRVSIDGGLCEECYTELGDLVHHKIYLTPKNIGNPDISLNHRNLKLVCKSCHEKIHNNETRITFDEFGNVLPKKSKQWK